MKISNNYQTLDSEFQRLSEKINQIKQVRESLLKELDTLHQSGFKDIKFDNLRQVVNETMKELNETNAILSKKSNELTEYSKIIKQYYAITI